MLMSVSFKCGGFLQCAHTQVCRLIYKPRIRAIQQGYMFVLILSV